MNSDSVMNTIVNEITNGVWASEEGLVFLERLVIASEKDSQTTNELLSSIENAVESKKAYEHSKELNGYDDIKYTLLNTYSRELKNVLRDVKQLMTNEYSSEHAEMLVELFLNKECK